MPNAHAAAVRAADRTNRELARLIGRLGTRRNPRGRILVAYRQAHRALRGNLDDPIAVAETLEELQLSVRTTAQEIFTASAEVGLAQAERELTAYGVPGAMTAPDPQIVAGAVPVVVGIAATQAQAVRGLAATGQGEGAVLGGPDRVGVLNPAPVVREAAKWVTVVAVASWRASAGNATRRGEDRFERQAVAAVDERTTETCLRVHGQIVPLNGRFQLRGTPRFADEMDAPPFHWYCRTATVLVPSETEPDDVTFEMRDAAMAELTARDLTGVLQEIHPASATSRR